MDPNTEAGFSGDAASKTTFHAPGSDDILDSLPKEMGKVEAPKSLTALQDAKEGDSKDKSPTGAPIVFQNPTPDGDPIINITVEPKYSMKIFISNNDLFLRFLSLTFMVLSNAVLKVLCKSFIKTIHPKKQKTYPYRKSKPNSPGQAQNSVKHPPWWPPKLRFKEPDHLSRGECEKLLEHLVTWCLTDTGFSTNRGIRGLETDTWRYHSFTFDSDRKKGSKRNERIYVLVQMFRIANKRESFLKGEIDESEVCHAQFFEKPMPYPGRKRKSSTKPSVTGLDVPVKETGDEEPMKRQKRSHRSISVSAYNTGQGQPLIESIEGNSAAVPMLNDPPEISVPSDAQLLPLAPYWTADTNNPHATFFDSSQLLPCNPALNYSHNLNAYSNAQVCINGEYNCGVQLNQPYESRGYTDPSTNALGQHHEEFQITAYIPNPNFGARIERF